MTFRACFALLIAAVGAGPVSAQSSLIDLSAPMTGASQYVFEADGTPVQMGVLIQRRAVGPAVGRGSPIVPVARTAPAAASRPAQAREPVQRGGTQVNIFHRNAPQKRSGRRRR